MAPTLDERIQSLPQELQDHILDFVITFNSRYIWIDETYKPPTSLQINRKTRAKAASTYYKRKNFFIAMEKHNLANPAKAPWTWFRSLAPAHKEMIKVVYTPTCALVPHRLENGNYVLLRARH